MNSKHFLTTLSNNQLTERLLTLRVKEHALTCEVLLYLAEVKERKLYLEQGFSSMFTFCVRKLHYSESAANRRIRSAQAIRAYSVCQKYVRLT